MGEFTRHAAQGKEEEKPVGHDTSGTIRHDTVYCLGSLNFKSFPVQEKVFTSPVGIIRLLFFLYFKTKLRRWSIFLHHFHSRHYESFPCTVRPMGRSSRGEKERTWTGLTIITPCTLWRPTDSYGGSSRCVWENVTTIQVEWLFKNSKIKFYTSTIFSWKKIIFKK
jgi:hypothetical protein